MGAPNGPQLSRRACTPWVGRRLDPTVEAVALLREACMSAPPRDEGPQGVRVDQVGPETVEKLTRARHAWREPPEAFEAGPEARAPGCGVRMRGCCARVPVCVRVFPVRPHPPRVPLQKFFWCRRVSACVTVRVSPPVTPELWARAPVRVTSWHVPGPRGLCPKIRALGDVCLCVTWSMCGMCSPG